MDLRQRLAIGVEDLRYAWRSITRAKALSAVLLVSLGIGTGANAAVFGAVRALLFEAPPGVDDSGSLLAIYTSEFSGAPYGESSWPDFQSVRAAGPFETAAAIQDRETVLVANAELARVAGVSGEFFATLDMSAAQGRLLDERDGRSTPQGAVISSTLWTALGEPGDLLNRVLDVGEREYRVVGIAAPGFRGLYAGRPFDVWVPLQVEENPQRGDRRLSVVARLRAGSSLDEAQDSLAALAARLAGEHPGTNRGTVSSPDDPRVFHARPYSRLDPDTRGRAAMIAGVVAAAVVLLLVSACVNAGSLLLSRGTARKRELAVKMALGAPRDRLVRQLLAESLLVSLGGGTLGLLLAAWTSSALPALFAPEHAAMLDTRLDAGLVLLTVGVSCAAGALFAIAPSFHATSAAVVTALRGDAGEISDARGSGRLRGILVVSQIALSTMLLIGAGLLTDSLAHALESDFGFSARRVAVISMEAPGGLVRSMDGMAYQAQVVRVLRELGGVEDAGFATTAPLQRASARSFRVEAGAAGATDAVDFDVNVVTPTYFRAMGMRILEGRPFDDSDRARSAPVAIVDEMLARRYFGAAAEGQHLLDGSGERLLIVGVVRSGRFRTLQESPRPTVYLPLAQAYTHRGYLFVRTSGDPSSMLPSISGKLRLLDSGARITRAATLGDHLADGLVIDRLVTTLVGLCGLLALVMSTLGVYGVMGDAVQRRTREIGLRVALGAGRPHVARLVFSEVVHLTAAGAAAGIAGAILMARAAQSFVYGLSGPDLVTLTATPAMLASVIIVAAVLPLRRALGVSPTIALRAE